MAALIGDTFGAAVTLRSEGGESLVVTGIFRRDPIEVPNQNGGDVLVIASTLRVRRDQAPNIQRGDLVEPSTAPGETFVVASVVPSGSPSSDSFLLCELELLEGEE